MKKRSLISLLLALAMMLTLTACGGAKAETVEGLEAVREMTKAFYANVLTADPIRVTTTMGENTSIFTKDGDKMCSEDVASETIYYAFRENDTNYAIYGGDTAYPDDFMFELLNNSIEMCMTMFVTGIMEVEDEGTSLNYKATRTDSANGSELVYVVTGESEGQAVELTVTGKADADGKVTDVDYKAVSGEESQNITIHFDYEGVSVTLPEYTIDPGDVMPEFDHVESPYATIQELIDLLGEDETLSYFIMNDALYTEFEKDGRHYQALAPISQEDSEALDALDFAAEDYDEKAYEIIGKLAITDCIDYTDGILSDEELSVFVGKPVREMFDQGFEEAGWSVGDDEVYLFLSRDHMEYSVKVTPSDDFDAESDFEVEDMMDFPVERVEFTQASTYFFPIG